MKINVTKGSAPLNLIKYLRDPTKQPPGTEIEVDTNLFGRTEEEQAEEFRFSHNLNPRVQQTMTHFSISLAPGERVDSQERHEITAQVLRLTGHEDCQYLSVEHFDHVDENDVQHWHIATSNVDLDGNHVEDDFLQVRLRTIEKQLEQEFDLVKAQSSDRPHIPTGEYRIKQRTGEELPREKLWDKIHQHTEDHPSMVTFAARLKAEGVNVKFWDRKQADEISGISYEIEGWKYRGGKLGASCSFPGLQKQLGVTHNSNQDQQLRQIEQMTVDQCREWLRLADLEAEAEKRKKERQARSEYYRDRYQHYCPSATLNPQQQDFIVAGRALQDNQSPEETLLVVVHGEPAQTLNQQQGKAVAIKYAESVTQSAIAEIERQQTRALERER